MIDYQTVGAYICESRKAIGLTQTELAEHVNVTHQAVSKWENGMTLPDTETLFALSKLFRVKIDDILNANKEQNPVIYSNEDTITEEVNLEDEESPVGNLVGLAPFIEQDVLDKELGKIDKVDMGNLVGLAPFLSREAVDKAVDRIVDDQIDMGLLLGLAPFASKEKLDWLFEKVMVYDVGNIFGIAPFVDSSTIEKAIRKIGIDNMDKGLLNGLAPFVSKEFLSDIIRNSD